ncbi:RNA polymerase II subunit A C-terminal domain phosphatase [Nematocida homosporus]|uniref:RNA polymerase II subunit A C-terminal domain phosphatase n=1 Tax=Nematocida homosporus TaxID=1912981 RepID=UPI00222111AF|nr:RNA polymerase II subunit A C-terminal domain phosphatase [Nematocida homosporus]KAI5187599.1 RNA polymerase II subunit A C-terminal domain phosphatase [Nematocida homosporus]
MTGQECKHPIRIHGLCGCCGAEIESGSEERLYTVLHNNSSVLLNVSEAARVNEASYERLMREGKMVLLLDLDQTVIHTSITRKFSKYFQDLSKYPVGKPSSREEQAIREVLEINVDGFTYYVKLRDGLRRFLAKAAEYFEIHIYTMGNRPYGTKMAEVLDRDKKIFGNRIVTRDDNLGCFEKDLARIFPTNTRNVVILDDRMDVWRYSPHVFPVRPYVFFRSGDINSPESLQGRVSEEWPADESTNNGEVGSGKGEVGSGNGKGEVGDGEAGEGEEGEGGGRKEELVRKIVGECIANLFDNELDRILGHLVSIHEEYFRTREDVAVILNRRKNLFAGCVARFVSSFFETERHLSALFVHFGGEVDIYIGKKTTHAIMAGGEIYLGMLPSKTIKYVSVGWVFESIYALKRLNEEDFLLSSGLGTYSAESESSGSSGSSGLSGGESGFSESEDKLYDSLVSKW